MEKFYVLRGTISIFHFTPSDDNNLYFSAQLHWDDRQMAAAVLHGLGGAFDRAELFAGY